MSKNCQRLAVAAVLLFLLGIGVRLAVFRLSAPIRVHWGLDNAWQQGSQALEGNERHFYRGVVEAYGGDTTLDYPPLRMYLITGWVKIVRSTGGAPAASGSTGARFDSILWPLLSVNAASELLAAAALLALCRLRHGWGPSLAAAAAWWLNPAAMLNSFVWPQWDNWPVWALAGAAWCVLAGRGWRCRAAAGALLGVAVMLKGQSLLAAAWYPAMVIGQAMREETAANRGRAAREAVATMLLGFFAVLFVVTLPFTMRGSAEWTVVFSREVAKNQALAIDAWNLPLVMADAGIRSAWVGRVLEAAFVAWAAWILLRSVRARDPMSAMLGPGLLFAAAFAVLPGMHERYALWAAALLIPALLRGRRGILLYSLVNAVAVLCPLAFCLATSPDAWPGAAEDLDRLGPALGLAWTVGTLAATVGLLHPQRVICPAAAPGVEKHAIAPA